MSTALVTGATGFIGPHLVRSLVAQGHDVICLRRKSSDVSRLEPLGVRFAVGDITQPDSLPAAVKNVDCVYHLAGLVKTFHAAQFWKVNEDGTENLLAACARQTPPPTVVMVSSLAAAGPATRDRPRLESDPAAPVSDYGRSKRAAELVAHRFADKMPLSIVRPPIVFGEGDKATSTMYKPIIWFGLHFTPTLLPQRFSLIHAMDLAEGIVACAIRGERIEPADGHRTTAHGYYFVAFDEQPTYGELGRMIGRAWGRRWTLVLPGFMPATWVIAAISDGLGRLRGEPAILGIDKAREAAAGSWTCSAEKAKAQLGWSCGATLQERLRQTMEWYKIEKWF